MKLTSDLSLDVEKFRSIYSWVCHNIENDYSLYLKNKHHRERSSGDSTDLESWNDKFKDQVILKLLNDQRTVCTGYAYLIKTMAEVVGIDCRVIHGYGRTASANVGELSIPNHSWNAARLNDKWYLCDATWSSGIIFLFDGPALVVNEFNEGFFLTDPNVFIKNHFPLDSSWTLVDNFSLSDFLTGPLVYNEAFQQGVNPIYPNQMNLRLRKNESAFFEFQISEDHDIQSLYFEAQGGFKAWSINPQQTKTERGTMCLQITPTKLGKYDLHLKLDDKYLVTYVVRVSK